MCVRVELPTMCALAILWLAQVFNFNKLLPYAKIGEKTQLKHKSNLTSAYLFITWQGKLIAYCKLPSYR